MLRRKKSEVLPQLPPLLFCDVRIPAGPVDAEKWFPQACLGIEALNNLLKEIEQEQAAMRLLLDHLPEHGNAANALAPLEHGIQKSRQWVELQKVEPVVELISQELDDHAYDKIVIFCWHKSVMAELMHRLKRFHPAHIRGGMHEDTRKAQEHRFQNGAQCRVLIGQTMACGVSITLTAAAEVAVVGPAFTPADNTQAVLRCHRIGQPRPVRARFFYIDNGTDKKMQQILMRRTRDMASLFDVPSHIVNPMEGL